MKKIKCYRAFATRLYKILLFLVMPVIIIAIQALIFRGNSLYGMFTAVILIASVEVLVDGLVFGGIAAKDAGGMEYLKTSAKGQKVLGTAISVNLVRQFVEEILILLVCQWIGSRYRWTELFEKGEISIFLAIALLGYFMTVSGVAAMRFFSNMLFGMVVMCVEILPIMGILRLMMFSYRAAILLLVVLSALAGIGGNWFAMKRGRESYYDKAD